ncbi:MAG: NAD-dependent protein deacetylase [Pseudomonadales bacterium]|nr:NAD-dependent protein deacetylase [Pseudomonadales bacterium]
MIEALTEALASHDRLLVLTGAGCSTSSGIGDYRDEYGEWKRRPPVQHRDFVEHLSWRQRYWARSQVGYPEFCQARPNRAHDYLAAWEAQGWVTGIITQNVDRLHQAAGSRRVIDLHGRLDEVLCLGCKRVTAREELQPWLEVKNPQITQMGHKAIMAPDGDADLESEAFTSYTVPQCTFCTGTLKPNVVFYGDGVPKDRVELAYRWVAASSVLLVVGSSLMVFSSFRFVRKAVELGIPVYAINRGKTRGDELFANKVDADCVNALRAIDNALP